MGGVYLSVPESGQLESKVAIFVASARTLTCCHPTIGGFENASLYLFLNQQLTTLALTRMGLASSATKAFYFVITSGKPLTKTNLTAKVRFSRVVLEGGKLANVTKNVQIQNTKK